jgi:predicted dehydrogenase
MGRGDLNGFLEIDEVQVVAVCDVDRQRAEHAAEIVETYYSDQKRSGFYKGCDVYKDFPELLNRRDIDAVMISSPENWHGIQAVMAAEHGKDIFVQKPFAYSIAEGRAICDAAQRFDRVLQVGSQQRSDARFRFACELVRNERIGKLKKIEVGFGQDPSGEIQPVMPVPPSLDYDMWLGPASYKPYTEARVHPNQGYGRPGWMRISEYSLGMITNWGCHHMDIAHWGMGVDHGGPESVKGWAEFPQDGLWDVHGAFSLTYTYKNDIILTCADNTRNRQGVFFEGSDGWVYVRRGLIDAHPKSLLKEKILPNEINLQRSSHHKQNFIDSIKSRKTTVAPAEVGHRSGSACIIGYIAMVTGKELGWSVEEEKFISDTEADRLLARPVRVPWNI